MSDNSKPAFPATPQGEGFVGMTLREWYAGMALQGMLANKDFCLFDETGDLMQDQLVARGAFQLADAMIAESQKGR